MISSDHMADPEEKGFPPLNLGTLDREDSLLVTRLRSELTANPSGGSLLFSLSSCRKSQLKSLVAGGLWVQLYQGSHSTLQEFSCFACLCALGLSSGRDASLQQSSCRSSRLCLCTAHWSKQESGLREQKSNRSGWTNLGQSLLGQSNAMYGLAELFLIP